MSHRSKLKFLVPAGFALLALFFASTAGAEGNLGDMVFDSKIESMKKAEQKPVVFPHTLHEELVECAKCHPGIFIDKRGANDISMRANMKGEFCGSPGCHDPVKFPLYQCAKCHTGGSE